MTKNEDTKNIDNDILENIEKSLKKKGVNIEDIQKDEDFDASLIEKAVPFQIQYDDEDIELVATTNEKELSKKKAKKVDISQINIVDKNELEKEKELKRAMFGNKAAFQIVAAQSGYMAKVLPLVHKDTVNLLYTNVDQYQYKKMVYQTVWEKIYETSVGKMDFNTWLQRTSAEDLETFMYGIYCATFQNEGTFSFSCTNCGETSDFVVNNRNLIKVADSKKMQSLIEDIAKNAIDEKTMEEFSIVGKTEAFELPDSKIIVEFRTPSLADILSILKNVPEETLARKQQNLIAASYTKRILIPAEKGGYIEITDKERLLKMLDGLTIDDSREMQNTILERVNENRITYSIKNIKCPHCGEVVKELPIVVEDILFSLIFERTQS